MTPAGGKRPGAGRRRLDPQGGKAVTIAIALSPALVAVITARAKEAGISRSLFISEILRAALDPGE